MSTALNEFQGRMAHFMEAAGHLAAPEERPECLFHYTRAGGVLGLLEQGAIWASDARCLNDESELIHARGLLHRALDGLDIEGASPLGSEYVRRLRTALTKLDSIYVACFSTQGDDLSQWRGYTEGSVGYSLAFDFDGLALATTQGAPVWLRPVVYSHEAQRAWLDSFIPPTFDLLAHAEERLAATLREADGAHALESALVNSLGVIAEFIFRFKNEAFAGEKEWRLCYTPATAAPGLPRRFLVKLREGRLGIVPYVEIPLALPALPLRSLTTGPSADHEIAHAMARRALEPHDLQGIPMHVSQVPLRH